MKSLLGGSPLFRRIMVSFLLASVFFLSLLTLVVYYSNEILEDDLLARQTEYELQNIRELLAKNPSAPLPRSASLSIYLESRQQTQPISDYLAELDAGVHHDIKIDDKAYHVTVASVGDDRVYIRHDVTEIERSEAMLEIILSVAWVVLLVVVFVISRILSKKLSGPIAQSVVFASAIASQTTRSAELRRLSTPTPEKWIPTSKNKWLSRRWQATSCARR
ncbi:MAG: hypothetical protein GWP56_05165 [Gammaproteobacteria bacterium]|nr:hypothetical protein [Gammaproteobacteria bacterium]